MSSASNQKHGYLAVVEQVEYEERGTMWGLSSRRLQLFGTKEHVITGDFGLSQREEWT